MNRNEKEQTLLALLKEYDESGIAEQIDYQKFYLYSIITHSTAIEGSTVTEIENQLLFDEGISAKKRSIQEQLMNLDLKKAYERSMVLARQHTDFSVDMLKAMSALVMKNTGGEYHTINGDFDASKGEFRLLGVTAGTGGSSYMNFRKVPEKMEEFCQQINERRRQLIESGNIIRRAKSLIPILVPLFVSAFRIAQDLALAMEARCYRGGENRTRMNGMKFAKRDYAAIVMMVAFLAVIIAESWLL